MWTSAVIKHGTVGNLQGVVYVGLYTELCIISFLGIVTAAIMLEAMMHTILCFFFFFS